MLTLTHLQFARGHCLLTTGLWYAATVVKTIEVVLDGHMQPLLA